MHRFPLIYVKASLVGLIWNRVSDLLTEHHLVAFHIIFHDIFQIRHKSLFIDQVEINIGVSCNLHTNIAFDKENKTPNINFMILMPFCCFCDLEIFLLEKQDFRWAPDDNSLIIHQDHLTDFSLCYTLVSIICNIMFFHCKWLSGSVKAIYFFPVFTIKAFLREIWAGGVKLQRDRNLRSVKADYLLSL